MNPGVFVVSIPIRCNKEQLISAIAGNLTGFQFQLGAIKSGAAGSSVSASAVSIPIRCN